MAMDRRARVFLTVLKDGRWHLKIRPKAVTVGVIEACVHLGLAERRLTKIRGTRSELRITKNGIKALKRGYFPDRETLAHAIHEVM
jgi:hypothetical protein